MSRQLDQKQEDRARARMVRLSAACDGALMGAVEHSGGILLGMSVKFETYDTLLTLRAEFPGGRMVAFVGGDSLGSALLKVVREGRRDGLKWRQDRYAKEQS